jgi:cation:H+ antiporter
MLLEITLFLVGLVLLYFGAEALVEGASGIALKMGVKPLVVGLTVVAFGTSSPELLVCLTAAIEHTEATDSISIGNIIGSNIANIALILGCASLVRPIHVTKQAVRREYPLMLAASFLLLGVILFDKTLWGADRYMLTRWDGALLAGGMAAYLLYSYMTSLHGDAGEEPAVTEELDEVDPEAVERDPMWKQIVRIGLGIPALAGGAYLMVESSVEIARYFEVPDLVIGISIVALGTSLPELATSLVAALNEASDISVGNVIGSNLFNILLVLGTVSLIAPIHVQDHVLNFDIWMMLAVALLIFPILQTGDRISRAEGVAMLLVYGGYIFFLFYRSSPTVAGAV